MLNLVEVHFVTYPSVNPWGSNFFYQNLSKHSENTVIEVTPKQSKKLRNSLIFYHNIQTIPKGFTGKPNIKTLKRKGNTVIAGIRGHVGFEKWWHILSELDHVVCNIDQSLRDKVASIIYNFTVFYPGEDSEIFRKQDLTKLYTLSWMGRDHKQFKNTDILKELKYSYNKATYKNYIPHHLIPNFLNRSKIHLVTSNHEGFCRPALEASLCEVPVIGPRIGVIPYLIDDEWIVNGDPVDCVDEYRELIKTLDGDE